MLATVLDLYSMGTFLLPCLLFLLWSGRRGAGGRGYLPWGLVFSFYCFVAIVQLAGIGTVWDYLAYGKLDVSVNYIPFASEGVVTYALNVIMFLPLGFLLPLLWPGYRRLGKTALTGLGMSVLIEVLQLFSLRTTDIDDLTMNTLGTVLGYAFWKLLDRLFLHGKGGYPGVTGYDPALLILLGTASTFLLYNWRLICH